jgi:hypothetical protein
LQHLSLGSSWPANGPHFEAQSVHNRLLDIAKCRIYWHFVCDLALRAFPGNIRATGMQDSGAETVTSGSGQPDGSQAPKRLRRLPKASHTKARLLTLENLDRRTHAAKKALELNDRLLAERGGAERLSTLRCSLIATVAALTAMIEDQVTRWLAGQDIDAAALMTLINARRREVEAIGIDPAPLDVTPPSLRDYLAAKATAVEEKP